MDAKEFELDVLLTDAKEMRRLGDKIAKAVCAMSVSGDYQLSKEYPWEVHIPSRVFNELFASHTTTLVDRGPGEYPFARFGIIGGVKFFILLEPKDLTKEESTKWITDALKARGGEDDREGHSTSDG